MSQPWSEVSQIWVPELNLSFGSAINSPKRLCYSYKLAGKYGGMRGSTAYNINEVQFLLLLPLSEFDANDPKWIRNELELKYGKLGQESISDDEKVDGWSSEDEQLLREEQESEREMSAESQESWGRSIDEMMEKDKFSEDKTSKEEDWFNDW